MSAPAPTRSGFNETNEVATHAQLFVASKGGTSHALVLSAKVAPDSKLALLRDAMKTLESTVDGVLKRAHASVQVTGHTPASDDWRLAAAVCVSGRLAKELNLTKIALPPFETISNKSGEPFFVKQDDEVLLLIKSERADLCYEVSKEFLIAAGSDLVDVWRTPTFSYLGGRDLTGFIDGTRNFGAGVGGIALVALLQRGTLDRNVNNVVDPAKKKLIADAYTDDDNGASFVFHGRFKHDLAKFRALDAKAQSEVIGRDITRIEVCELAYAQGRLENPMLESEPDHSHMQRSAGAMARQAWPFVQGADEGLEFLAFSRDFNILDASLKSMAGHLDGTQPDRLMSFSRGVACGIFFVPSRIQLSQLRA